MLGGADAAPGVGGVAQLTVTGSWAADDTFNIVMTTAADGQSTTLGAGALTNQNPTFGLTYKKKVYLLGGGTILYFSALNDPTVFNDLNAAGNSVLDLANEYGFTENVLGAAIYQGRMACFARNSIQIVAVDPDPANYAVPQTLENIGTVNAASIQGIGDLDVLFCADSGFRSLRVRDSSNNAGIVDLGTPIDSIIQARLLNVGVDAMASVVEPISARYWCSVGNVVYVFSYFPSSGVTAWSTYDASISKAPVSTTYTTFPGGYWTISFTGLIVGRTYRFTRGVVELAATSCVISDGVGFVPYVTNADGTFVATETSARVFLQQADAPATATAILAELFTPEKFEKRAGLVYVRNTSGKIYVYGGTNNATYDDTVCSWETPWLDARSAATNKLGAGVDAGLEGGWALKFGQDYRSGILKEVYRNNESSFGLGVIPATAKGTHFKVRGQTYAATYARFSVFAFHFEGGDSR